jgi:hypothetical protein
MIYSLELTDTFGGQANYSWVERAELEASADTSPLALVRQAKAVMGLSGCRCRRFNSGEIIELRPVNSCTVLFITPCY